MLDPEEFRRHIIRPVLAHLDLSGAAAEDLLLGTAVMESDLAHFRQLGGPARGLYQMEPATEEDLWRNYLDYRPALAARVRSLLAAWPPRTAQLVTNLSYATAMCRLHYRRVPAALPVAGDIESFARYWKRYYNTALGKGTPAQFVLKYRALVSSHR